MKSLLARSPIASVTLVTLLAVASAAWAENIDLVTLPTRESVQLTIYNSEDLTLVKETRQIALKKGRNRLQFSWANTLIDPTSVEFRPLAHTDQIELTDAVFPGQKPQHLIWNIDSKFEGQVPVEVSYFTSGLSWQMDYVAISDPDETKLDFRGYVRVSNQSGEEYENAEVRLIVGTINLVEKIAALAQKANLPVAAPGSPQMEELRRQVVLGSISSADAAGGGSQGASKPREIVKEGLSEYFMFSVAGEETVPNGWSKRMRAVQADAVNFDIVYRMRAYQYGPRPVRFFLWRNDAEHKLGESPLPNGVVRLFRDNGRDGLSYLGQQSLEYVPVKARIEVNLGPDDLVVFDRRKTGTQRLNFTFNDNEMVTGWDERQAWVARVCNYRDEPIRCELRLQLDGDVELTPTVETSSFDYRTVETPVAIDAHGKSETAYTALIHQQTNSRQNRLLLKPRP